MYFYEYWVEYYDEGEDKEITQSGLTYAVNYASAMKNIARDYGNDEIIKVTLQETCDENTYEVHIDQED